MCKASGEETKSVYEVEIFCNNFTLKKYNSGPLSVYFTHILFHQCNNVFCLKACVGSVRMPQIKYQSNVYLFINVFICGQLFGFGVYSV